VRRRKLLAGLAATAASAAGAPLLVSGTAQADEALLGELLVARLRDAMLGLGPAPTIPPAQELSADFTRALADFDACRYASLAVRLPRLIRAGHALTAGGDDTAQYALLAKSYLLATRMLVKMDEQQLGWMAADRAWQLAEAAQGVLAVAESARQLAVLARKAGWHSEALSIALSAADHPDLRRAGRAGSAVRGLLVQSASYTLARRGDRDGMRELTDEAAAIAKELGGVTLLRDHGGGFSPLTVTLHRISAENHAGDPLAALAAARSISLKALPSVERRSRALGDIAVTYDRLGRRTDCVRTLLAAEQCAPQETHARPATKSLISSLLVSGLRSHVDGTARTRRTQRRPCLTNLLHPQSARQQRSTARSERSTGRDRRLRQGTHRSAIGMSRSVVATCVFLCCLVQLARYSVSRSCPLRSMGAVSGRACVGRTPQLAPAPSRRGARRAGQGRQQVAGAGSSRLRRRCTAFRTPGVRRPRLEPGR
jgi:hypothetical protein